MELIPSAPIRMSDVKEGTRAGRVGLERRVKSAVMLEGVWV